jgi:hypothetical protein
MTPQRVKFGREAIKREQEIMSVVVVGSLGDHPGAILGPGRPKVSAGTEKERNSELFPPVPGP